MMRPVASHLVSNGLPSFSLLPFHQSQWQIAEEATLNEIQGGVVGQ